MRFHQTPDSFLIQYSDPQPAAAWRQAAFEKNLCGLHMQSKLLVMATVH